MARREKPILRVKVKGPGVRSGRISVPDLIRLCEETQGAVIRQAEAIEGRKTQHPGPTSGRIRSECTLELIGLKRGSTTLEFGLASPQLRITETKSVAVEAIAELTKTIKVLSNGKKKKEDVKIDEGVLHGIMGLGQAAQAKGISYVQLIAGGQGPRDRSIVAAVTQAVTAAVAKRLSRPRRASVTVDGYLEMADFKPGDHKCRIEPPMGPAIACTFIEEQSNLVHSLIRKAVRITGEATFPPNSEKIELIVIKTIDPLPSLAVGTDQFLSDMTMSDLAKAQHVEPIKSASQLEGGFPAEEDIDEFLRQIYENRK